MKNLDRSPLARAAFRLAREFGWTPQQVRAMTMAEISVYMHLLEEEAASRHAHRRSSGSR
jgi:hypothetical protein